MRLAVTMVRVGYITFLAGMRGVQYNRAFIKGNKRLPGQRTNGKLALNEQ